MNKYLNYLKKLEEISKNRNMTEEQKVQLINEAKNEYEKSVNTERNIEVAKNVGGAALEIGSGFVPIASGGTLGAKLGAKFLGKSIGNKLSKEIGSGIVSGAGAGAVFGAGQGLMEDKNPVLTSLQDSLTGAVAGGVLGGTGGLLQKTVKAKQLENAKISKDMTLEEMLNLRKQGKQYYKDYIQNRLIHNSEAGDINFPNSQVGEIGLHNYNMIPKLPKQIRNAKNLKISNDKPERTDALNFVKVYNNYKGKQYEYLIRNNSNNTGKDFYQIKQVGSTPAYSHQNRALKIEPNSIIDDNFKNVNPSHVAIPLKMQNGVLKTGINMDVDRFGNKIFTPDEIGKMSNEEFEQNEQIINQQLKDGLIKPQVPDFANYAKQNGGKIFSREDISEMSAEEYKNNEDEIMKQLRKIGIPRRIELFNNSKMH